MVGTKTERYMKYIWKKLHIEKDFSNIIVSREIIDSWKRTKQICRTNHISQIRQCGTVTVNEEELYQRNKMNEEILREAMPIIKDLHSKVKAAGLGIVFADHEGYVLKQVGKPNHLEDFFYNQFAEGTKWSEDEKGTNAIGLVLVLDKPVQVYGYEHYCRYNCISTSLAAPIHDQIGNISGVVGLIGSYHNIQDDSMLMLMQATAQAIELRLELKKVRSWANNLYDKMQLLNLNKETIINAISEGLITIDHEQIIAALNPQVCKILNLFPADVDFWLGKHINEILDIKENYIKDAVQSQKEFYSQVITLKNEDSLKKLSINCVPYDNDLNDYQGRGALIVLNNHHSSLSRSKSDFGAKTCFDNLIGESKVFLEAVEQAKMVAESSSNVLLTGESGVGKDLFAQAIHNAGSRKDRPFIGINCAVIPKDLVASELFGYDDGAFTGSHKGGNPGKFELADQGTLFLDEIADMPLDLQAALLRVLEERSILRLGGRRYIPVDVRIIAATNKNLSQEIVRGTFRQDLFFRINVVSICLPALRERSGDIPVLVDHMVDKLSRRLNKTIKQVRPEVVDCFMNYEWPGNIRELNNAIERAINLCKDGIITADLLSEKIRSAGWALSLPKWKKNLLTEDEENERQLILYYLTQEENNRSKVAQRLKLSRSSLYRKMKKYQID